MDMRKISKMISSDIRSGIRKPVVHRDSASIDGITSNKTTPLSTQWISEELLLETRKLWSKAYKRVISNEEAVEILMNVKLAAEVLVRMQKENNSL